MSIIFQSAISARCTSADGSFVQLPAVREFDLSKNRDAGKGKYGCPDGDIFQPVAQMSSLVTLPGVSTIEMSAKANSRIFSEKNLI